MDEGLLVKDFIAKYPKMWYVETGMDDGNPEMFVTRKEAEECLSTWMEVPRMYLYEIVEVETAKVDPKIILQYSSNHYGK